MKNLFIFVIDTDQYAGNFEREMCAYMTGHIGQCEVGKEWAELYRKEEPNDPFDGIILDLDEDEYLCPRPVFIVNTDSNPNKSKRKWIPNSVGIYFDEWPIEKEVILLKERAINFTKLYSKDKFGRDIKILGFRKITRTTQEIEKFI